MLDCHMDAESAFRCPRMTRVQLCHVSITEDEPRPADLSHVPCRILRKHRDRLLNHWSGIAPRRVLRSGRRGSIDAEEC